MNLKLFTCIAACVLLNSCSQEEPPAPAAPPPPSNNMSLQEQALVGDWILRQSEYVDPQTGSVSNIQTYNNPSGCHLNLTANTYTPNTTLGYEAIAGLTCSGVNTYWKISSSQLNVAGGMYTIEHQSTDSLVLRLNTARWRLNK